MSKKVKKKDICNTYSWERTSINEEDEELLLIYLKEINHLIEKKWPKDINSLGKRILMATNYMNR